MLRMYYQSPLSSLFRGELLAELINFAYFLRTLNEYNKALDLLILEGQI